MGRNRKVPCNICSKSIRGDHLPRHLRSHGVGKHLKGENNVKKSGICNNETCIFSPLKECQIIKLICKICQCSKNKMECQNGEVVKKKHMCPYCNYGSIYNWVLDRHVEKRHPKTKPKVTNNKANTNKDKYIKLIKALRAHAYVEKFISNYTNVASQEEEEGSTNKQEVK